ncbi:MAG TPA: four helix bundle protein [Polyangiaceae bacterium]|jgi:four helix bundle protein
MLGFQRLDAYRCAVEFLAVSANLSARVPRGHGDLADQLRRAALSIPLNIAEGSGKGDRDAFRFYRIARGSALECVAVLDAMEALKLVEREEIADGLELLERVVAMLTKLGQA